MRQELLYAFVASGSQVSSPVALKNALSYDVWAPAVNSVAAFRMQASIDQTSANFFFVEPLLPNTGTYNLGQGSKFIALGVVGAALAPYVRAHLSTAQTAPRTLVFVTKL